LALPQFFYSYISCIVILLTINKNSKLKNVYLLHIKNISAVTSQQPSWYDALPCWQCLLSKAWAAMCCLTDKRAGVEAAGFISGQG
jgi:hypothetical protein